MSRRRLIANSLYFFGAAIFLISGIILKSTAPVCLGILLIYSGIDGILWNKKANKIASGYVKKNLIWNIFFLGVTSIVFFSLTKVLFNVLLRGEVLSWNSFIPVVSLLGIIYFEIIFRIGTQKKSRFAALVILPLFILSTGAVIFGGYWLKTDLLLGFLSLTVTVIISFRNTYIELSNLLEKNRDNNEH